jgi:hypothetical protein
MRSTKTARGPDAMSRPASGLPPASLAHVPGSGTRPDRAALEPVKLLCPPAVAGANWREVPPYLAGLDLYAAGFFWEAHEVWEPVWMACAPASPERSLVAGLIQLTNACLKLRMARPRATMRLLDAVLGHLAAARATGDTHLMGLDLAILSRDVMRFRGCLADASQPAAADALLAHRPALGLASRP